MAKKGVSTYDLSRQWFDFVFENQDKVSGNHTALYFWLVELNNKLNWIENFGAPSTSSMAAMGNVTYKTYRKAMDDLIKWGFIKMVKESLNQYQANTIALVIFTKAEPKHLLEQNQSKDQSKTEAPTIAEPTYTNLETFKPLNPDFVLSDYLLQPKAFKWQSHAFFPDMYLLDVIATKAIMDKYPKKIKSIEELGFLATEFNNHLATISTVHATMKAWQEHFVNTMNIKLSKKDTVKLEPPKRIIDKA